MDDGCGAPQQVSATSKRASASGSHASTTLMYELYKVNGKEALQSKTTGSGTESCRPFQRIRVKTFDLKGVMLVDGPF